jgi:hypothetical protein
MSNKHVYAVIVLAEMFITLLQGCDIDAARLDGTGRDPG